MNPIEQFHIARIVPLHVFGYDVSFTNSSLFMVVILAAIVLVVMFGARNRSVVPGRVQSLAEVSHEFVADMIHQTTGEEGMRYFPFVFTLFMFIFVANVIGLIPYSFTVTSHLIITVTLALMVFLMVIVIGFARNGFGFLKMFVPSGIPGWILPFVVVIEVISFFTRPVSHSIRLFANMLAGHVTLQVFSGFVLLLLGAGFWGVLAPIPFLFTVAIFALELLVSFLQAYVFAMLTCLYLNDALHPGH